MTRKLPSRSESSKGRSIHSRQPSIARSRIAGFACGATTRSRNPVFSRLPIFSKATAPAPTSRPGRPSSLRKTGNRLMTWSSISDAVGHAARGQVALDRRQNLTRQIGAQLIVRVAQEPGAQVLFRQAAGEVVAEQTLDRFRHQRRGAAIAYRACDGSVLAHRSAEAEVIRVGELALVLDFFALDADVGDPVLSAAIGAAGDVQPELLVKRGQPLFELIHDPACKALGFRDGQLAKLRAGAGDRATPERRTIDMKADLPKFPRQFCCLVVGNVDQEQVLRDSGAQRSASEALGKFGGGLQLLAAHPA